MREQKGFTLIETVMAIVIVSILATLGAPLLAVGIEAMTLQMDRANLLESGMMVTARLSRELRRCRDEKSLKQATANTLEFFDRDGLLIRYRFAGGLLLRREGTNPERVLSSDLQDGASAFSYFDGKGNVLGAPLVGENVPTDIRRVEVDLKFQDGPHTMPVRISICPRNLNDEDDLFS